MKNVLLIACLLIFVRQSSGQTNNCVFKEAQVKIDFGTGFIDDANRFELDDYSQVSRSCPTDGHYAYTDFTSDCFRGDWQTLPEDHTAGDAGGNMLIVNSSYNPGTFFKTEINGLKNNTVYEFGVWMMNVCRITEKCPFPLLPNITIYVQTASGKTLARFGTGDLERREAPHWTQYRAVFTNTGGTDPITLTMVNNKPGGCGNDFALDDITFRECVPPPPVASTTKKITAAKKQTVTNKPVTKKQTASTVKKQPPISKTEKPRKDSSIKTTPVVVKAPKPLPPLPAILRTRTNSLVKQIDTDAGEIKIDLYDNGEIDGDTVSIYHNNTLVVAHKKLSQKPITLRIAVNDANPHHELVMVAENLGSIPPNTSLMIITAGPKRYQAFITSTEQKNAKVVLELKR